jgi:hypothetical protein
MVPYSVRVSRFEQKEIAFDLQSFKHTNFKYIVSCMNIEWCSKILCEKYISYIFHVFSEAINS